VTAPPTADDLRRPPPQRWINSTVLGIVLATLLSDFGHEMCTAVLPLYIDRLALGAAGLGLIEGLADLAVSLSKLGGGVLGHRVQRKRPWAASGYLITAVATGAIGLARSLPWIVSLRVVAWIGRGYRGPLRDFLLADAVEKTHYGRAFGLERAGDMLGAVSGPLVATLLLWGHVPLTTIILVASVPGIAAAAAMFFLVRERPAPSAAEPASPSGEEQPDSLERRLPRRFWLLLVGVLLFGLGDFSRTFIIWLASGATGHEGRAAGTISLAVLLYTAHNLISALAAYPLGHWGDRARKLPILTAGYALGVLTNVLFAFSIGSLPMVAVATVLSGIYIAAEETLEKATIAELLPRRQRSLGLGILAGVNAVGDMVSSVVVGLLLDQGQGPWAFGLAAGCGAAGVLWMLVLVRRDR